MSEYITTTVEALHRALPEPVAGTITIMGKETPTRSLSAPDGVEIRLRTATIAFFPLAYVDQKGKGYWIGMRKSKLMRQGGVYMPVRGDVLIDVRGLDLPESDKVECRGWRDMRLSDLAEEYKGRRP